jgi:hypothetical protein
MFANWFWVLMVLRTVAGLGGGSPTGSQPGESIDDMGETGSGATDVAKARTRSSGYFSERTDIVKTGEQV